MKTLDNVATIISLFEEAAEREGYNFCLSHRDEMPQATKADKILWLYTPLFLSQEGITHGRQRYRVCVALIHRQQKATAAQTAASQAGSKAAIAQAAANDANSAATLANQKAGVVSTPMDDFLNPFFFIK